jgi:hypothetical protein
VTVIYGMPETTNPGDAQHNRWPPELKDLQSTLFLEDDEADLASLSSSLVEFAGPRADSARAFGFWVFFDDPVLPSIGRFTYRAGSPDRAVQLTLVFDPHMVVPAAEERSKFPPWDAVWSAINQNLNANGRALEFYTAARFEFSTDSWEPVAELPVPITGLVPEPAGTALLTGFTLEFSDQTHPIRRLSIVSFAALKEVDGRFNFYVSPSVGNKFPSTAVDIATRYQNLIAKPRTLEVKPQEANSYCGRTRTPRATNTTIL